MRRADWGWGRDQKFNFGMLTEITSRHLHEMLYRQLDLWLEEIKSEFVCRWPVLKVIRLNGITKKMNIQKGRVLRIVL